MDDITLSTGTRRTLLSIQRTTTLIGRTQERLATGRKVNSALDDALAFFKARNLSNRAFSFDSIKAGIADGLSLIRASVQGLEAIESTLKQMKATAQSAVSSPESSTRGKLASQFNELRSQVDNLAEDSSFNGVNLLKNSTAAFAGGADSLTVKFNERIDPTAINQLVVSGVSSSDFSTIVARSAVASGGLPSGAVWGQTGAAAVGAITGAIRAVDSALITVRQVAQELGTNSALLEIRRSFSEDLINTLERGAANLVNADLNEESANLLSLQTRQQLGIIQLSIGGGIVGLLERLT